MSAVVPARTVSLEIARAPEAQGMGRLWRNGQFRLGLCLVMLAIAVSLIGPFIAPHDPTKSTGIPFQQPGSELWFGADQLGRDVLSRTLSGGLHIVWMAPLATVLAVACGASIGLTAAYLGGFIDIVLMRLMDILLAFPAIIFALMFVSIIGPSPWLLVGLIALALMPGVARVVRGTALPLVDQEYVQWTRSVGVSSREILFREILPNVTSPLFVELGIRLMIAINLLASLSFIGYGIQPPTADWGLMVSENRTGLSNQPLSVFAPILMIVLFTVGGNLMAEGAARVLARTDGRGTR